MATYFITAIDTDTGKTVVTGLLAKYLAAAGKQVFTQKIAQTGCDALSEDIVEHRRLMGVELNEDDKSGLSCPYVFSLPASPHLSAELEGKSIDPQKIKAATDILATKYELLLVEGVGGIQVPLTRDYMVSDYLADMKYETILVCSSKIGSINHSLLSLEHMKQKGIRLRGVIYNHYPYEDERIVKESAAFIKEKMQGLFADAFFAELLPGDIFKFHSEVKF